MDKEHNIPTSLIMKDLKDVLSVLEKHGVKAYLAYGAVLGAVREKDFIKWDDDVDLDIIDDIDFKTRKMIGHTLGVLGFKAQSIAFNVYGAMEMSAMGENGECAYDGDDTAGIIVCERNFKFSLFFYFHEEDEYVCYPKLGSLRLISIPDKFHTKHETIKLHGEKFETPSPLKEYLAYVYGKDWKTPIKDLHAPNCVRGKQKRE